MEQADTFSQSGEKNPAWIGRHSLLTQAYVSKRIGASQNISLFPSELIFWWGNI